MKLNKEFVLGLRPSLSELLPTGSLGEIAINAKIGRQSIAAAAAGRYNSPTAVRECVKFLIDYKQKIEALEGQVPKDVLAEIKKELQP